MIKLFITFLLLLTSVKSDRPRVWLKIPHFYVVSRVEFFLNQNRLTNCFEFRESETNLLLKCWRDNQLTDVSIEINPGKKVHRGLTISI